jgi:hypothetical protein
MKISAALAGMLLVLLGMTSASATVRISADRGGRIINYLYKFAILRAAGEHIVIDGTCASACTMILGAIPKDRICVTQRAALGFHAAWEFGAGGRQVTSQSGTKFLLATYPPEIRSWISQQGGLTQRMIVLRGRELAALYPTCDSNGASRAAADDRSAPGPGGGPPLSRKTLGATRALPLPTPPIDPIF